MKLEKKNDDSYPDWIHNEHEKVVFVYNQGRSNHTVKTIPPGSADYSHIMPLEYFESFKIDKGDLKFHKLPPSMQKENGKWWAEIVVPTDVTEAVNSKKTIEFYGDTQKEILENYKAIKALKKFREENF